MKLKYYLRGAGIGMIAATAIMAIAFLSHRGLSDAEIMERAMELGMVMEDDSQSRTLADSVSEKAKEEDNDQEASKRSTVNKASDPAEKKTAQSKENKETATDDTPDTSDLETSVKDSARNEENGSASGSKREKKEESAASPGPSLSPVPEKTGKMVSVTINAGDVSRIVSVRVQSAGLVNDAADFNRYLGDHGYDRLLHSGTYHIQMGSTYEEIAKKLTSKAE